MNQLLSFTPFSHGDAALDHNAVLIVNDSVQNTFGDSTAFVFGPVTVNAIISVIYILLGTEPFVNYK